MRRVKPRLASQNDYRAGIDSVKPRAAQAVYFSPMNSSRWWVG